MTKILIVEDEPGIAFALESDLQTEGYSVPARLRIGRRHQKKLRSPLIWLSTSALKSMHSSGAESHRSWIWRHWKQPHAVRRSRWRHVPLSG